MTDGCSKTSVKTISTQKPRLLGNYEIILGGHNIPYSLKRSSRARLLWLNITRDQGLTVTVPSRYNLRNLPEYLSENSGWILKNYSKFCDDLLGIPEADGYPVNTIPYLGHYFKVMPILTNSSMPESVTLDTNLLVISLPNTDRDMSIHELETWMKAESVKTINFKVQKFSELMGLRYNRVCIRDQRSRWGSCSCLKNLNFNWRLIMAPEPVLDYVIIHELCHLKEMNHSTSFWNLVAEYCPKWHEYREWLDCHRLRFNARLSF